MSHRAQRGRETCRMDTPVAIAPFDTRPSQSANPVAGLPFTPTNRAGEGLKNKALHVEKYHRPCTKNTCTHRQKRIATNPSIWNQKSRFLHGFNAKLHPVALLKTFLKKPEKRCWQMGDGVIIYLGVRENSKQIATETDEVWIETPRKSKNSA